MRISALGIGYLALALATGSALANTSDAPMQFRLIQSGGDCADICPEWISAEGYLDVKAASRFRDFLAKVKDRRLPVVVDSPGGDPRPAMSIGRMIRARQLDIIVARTALLPCDPILPECKALQFKGVHLGRIVNGLAWCASACTLLIAGGTRRFVGPDARLGVHGVRWYRETRIREWTVNEPDPSAEGGQKQRKVQAPEVRGVGKDALPAHYAPYAEYFKEMGVSQEVVQIMKEVPGADIRTLVPEEAKRLMLATDVKGPREVLYGETPRTPAQRNPPGPTDTPLFRKN